MSPTAVLSLIYWLVHHTHLFLRYSVSKRTPVMSVHVRIYTWIRRRERLPFVVTVKFPVNHSGTLAGWLGSLSASFRAAGLIPTGVEVGLCVPVYCKSICVNAKAVFFVVVTVMQTQTRRLRARRSYCTLHHHGATTLTKTAR